MSSKWDTSVTKIKNGCSNSSCLQGVDPEMLFLLQQKLNFTFTITKEPVIGSEQENGSWTGTIGELIKLNNIFEFPFLIPKK